MDTGLNLLVHVREVKVELNSDVELVVNATVDDVCKKTQKHASSNKPHWNEDLQFHVKKVFGAMKIELIAVKRQQLLGFTSIPLFTVRHTNKSSKGAWKTLHIRSVNGELEASGHALRLDAHFQLPKGIPEDELIALEKKLMECSEVLEKEAKILEEQHFKLENKHLPLPEKGQGAFSYPKMKPSESSHLAVSPTFFIRDTTPCSTASSESESPVNAPEIETHSIARNRWKKAVAHPDFQKKIAEMMKANRSTKKTGFNPAILELVSHLQGLEKCQLRKRSGPSRKKTMNAMNQIRSRLYHRKSREEMAGVAKHTIDEDVRIHVYKTTLSTLIYPVTQLHHHDFEEKSFKSPTYCRECEGFIYGMTRQGYQCKRCGKTCHKKCIASARADCFHIKSTDASFTETYLTTIKQVIEANLRDRQPMFSLLREAFNVDQIENKTLITEVSDNILRLAHEFSATIIIKVMAAQGLATHTLSDAINLYVSLDLGSVKKRTKSFKAAGSPSWNEEFKFDCKNMLEPIKVRVWNERHNTWGKLSKKLTSESDVFLGQKIIEVMTLGVAKDIWYTLEKRTENNIVSGSIKLNVSCVVAGEFHVASFHKMYSLLHEQLFLYEHVKQMNDIAPLTEKVSNGGGSEICFFSTDSQIMVDAFAHRYAIEPVFRLMVHMKLLVDHSSYVSCAYSVLISTADLIKNQLLQFAAEQNSILGVGIQRVMQEVLSASNFGKDHFARCLDKLMTQLKVELQQYRLLYPVDDSQRLKDFESNCKLIKTILDLQVKLMGVDPRTVNKKYRDIIESCLLECIRQTFDDIVQQTVPETYEGHPGMQPSDKPYEFFYNLLDGMESMEYEDRTVYGPLVSKHCDIVLGDCVALTIWDLFKTIIQDVFQEEEHLTVFPPMEAIHLQLTVKDHYEKHVLPAFPKGNVPDLEYPHWFEPAIIFWMEDFQKKTNDVIKNAWEIDKQSNFEPHNEERFSSSAFDMIDYFHKGYQVTKRFDEGVVELRHKYNLAYARVIKNSIVQYCDMVSGQITNQSTDDLEVTCMLLNNIQFLRYGVETLYTAMGGQEDAGEECSEELKDLQSILGRQVNSWCKYVGKSIKDDIWEGIQQVQQEMLKLKGQGQLTKEECKFAPLLSRLFKYCKTFRDSCQEKHVLPKLINRIWIIVVQGIHNMLLPPLPGIARDDVEDSHITFVPHGYSAKQCAAIDRLLDYLKDFFEDDSLGVKEQTLVGNIKQFKVFTKLYQQTTDALITEFVKDFAAKAKYDGIDSSGEVSLEVSALRHPATGEFDGKIRVISARDLQEFKDVQVLKPQIELTLIVPGSQNPTKLKYVATTKEPSTSPSFNQTFKFVLPPNSLCELEITAKHKAYIGGSKLIGVAVLPLKTALQSDMHTVDLNNHLPITDFGRVLLTILAQRTSDEIAKEFVELKTQCRRE